MSAHLKWILSHVLGSMESHRKIMMHFLGISILLEYLEMNIKYLINSNSTHLTMFYLSVLNMDMLWRM